MKFHTPHIIKAWSALNHCYLALYFRVVCRSRTLVYLYLIHTPTANCNMKRTVDLPSCNRVNVDVHVYRCWCWMFFFFLSFVRSFVRFYICWICYFLSCVQFKKSLYFVYSFMPKFQVAVPSVLLWVEYVRFGCTVVIFRELNSNKYILLMVWNHIFNVLNTIQFVSCVLFKLCKATKNSKLLRYTQYQTIWSGIGHST